ncbi:MAG: flagellar basal-body rod protein FlgG [Spirochaetaceae bacterium]|jgi:flagellar basal-body rod protein FlgG|nr:flagellar basal-body rod protein FlgG [Spirochaetaceae bacterium]
MVTSLWTGAAGMTGMQNNIDNISNNLANVNTYGYKKTRAEFEDLLYQTIEMAGTPATADTVRPLGVQMGHGIRLAATQRMFSQGAMQASDGPADMAINGEGFFRVQMYDGSYAYSRDGSFKIDANGRMVSSQGYWLQPDIVMPENFDPATIAISQDGRVSVRVAGNDDPWDVGQIELYRFPNAAGLNAVGENLYKESVASGSVVMARPGENGMGTVYKGYLEMSNVSIVQEMVDLIVAQRAYEFNSRTIQTTDSMLATATGLKR